MKKILIVVALSALLCACDNFFDKDNTPPPSPLVNLTPEANVQSLWYTSTGSGTEGEYLKLTPALTDKMIFTASKNGTLTATDKTTGKELWKTYTNASISAGPSAAEGIVLVGSRDGKIIALHQNDGKIAWTSSLSSEILAAPAANNGVVLAKAIDGKLSAFSKLDGHTLWSYQQNEPTLILRGASAPQIQRDTSIIGFANGNLVKLSLQEGSQLWQKTIAIPNGVFSIQRMVDIDADPIIFGNRIYAATYQGRIAAFEFESGKELWTHDLSSYSGIAADNDRVYISDAKSHVWAFDADSGRVDWRQPQLEARNITGPAIMGNYLVVGDAEGYLHWLNKQDGHFVARVQVNSSGIIATPVVVNNVLYVVTMDGHLAAYRV